MSRYIDADALIEKAHEIEDSGDIWSIESADEFERVFDDYAPSIDIDFCKDCKHRPVKEDADGADFGFNIIAPEGSNRCPCLVDDGWYSWMPKDNFFCGYGEREDEQ